MNIFFILQINILFILTNTDTFIVLDHRYWAVTDTRSCDNITFRRVTDAQAIVSQNEA